MVGQISIAIFSGIHDILNTSQGKKVHGQTLDRQTLDRQTLDRQTLDMTNPGHDKPWT
jgi:hypothetical protein